MISNSSIDQTELNKFNKTAAEWWDEAGEFKLLHQINPLRIKYITDTIASLLHTTTPAGLNILDIGCGGGLISFPLHKLGASVTALDANKHNIDAAATYAKTNGLEVTLINSTIEEYLKAKNNAKKFDVVLCLEVIEHVSNPKEFVQNLTKLVTANGIIILSTLNRTIKSFASAIIMAEYVLRWVPLHTHNWQKFIKPSELDRMLQGTTLCLKELKGLKFDPISDKWYLSDDINVNYFAVIGR